MEQYEPKAVTKMAVIEANMVNFMNSLTKGEKRMDNMEKDISELKDTSVTIKSDVTIIKNALIGNGQEGMIKRVSRHEKTFNIHHGGLAIICSLGMITGTIYTVMKIMGG